MLSGCAAKDAALSSILLLILRGRRGDERDPAQADARGFFALEEDETKVDSFELIAGLELLGHPLGWGGLIVNNFSVISESHSFH
jgi:hypothetical protein